MTENTWLAAVSGGPDSMAMLMMCMEKGIEIEAAHVNYHHREEADEEEAYVRAFCAEHHILFHVLNKEFTYQGNFEAAARQWRYDFFVKIVKERGLKGVLVGHHEDDLLETFFMQEEKNIVPEYYGLKEEMMYKGILVRRPLLGYTKKQLEEYCDRRNIRYYIDRTNLEDAYTRNRIRHEIVEPMSRMQRDMVLQEIRMKNAVKQERVCRVKTMHRDGKVSLKQYRMLNEEDRLALLRIAVDENNRMSLAYLKECDEILRTKNDFMIPCRQRYIVQDGGYFFTAEEPEEYCDVYADQDALYDVRKKHYMIGSGSPGVNAVTVTEDDFPLTVRSFQDGDSIEMRFGRKKVSRFFIDRHIPQYLRRSWPVVVNRHGKVILVPGLGCDTAHFSINPDFNVLQYTASEGD